jgi:prepilin signal peptidase PulO-like enzyme (type II secretory pathway)
MYINIYITGGVNTIGISDPSNMIHMVTAILNFVFTFIVMTVGFLYAMKKVAIFSAGAVVCLIVGTLGGLVFLETGGGRLSGSVTLAGGWIMSILFMLALFLSYYATLKIVRAIKVLEATNRP